jgi:hypothetical protein
MDPKYTFDMPVLLALHDYLPVFFSAVGLCLLAQMIARMNRAAGVLAWLGFFLVVAGGVFKATYKLDMATVGADYRWMDSGIFVWMGPGFTIMAWALWVGQRTIAGKRAPQPVWLVPALLCALVLGTAAYLWSSAPQARTWSLMLLGVTTIGNFALSGLAIAQSWRQGLKLAVALFVFNIVAILVLQGLARLAQDSLALQWTQQFSNMFSNLAFAVAAWQLHDSTKARLGVSAFVSRAAAA